ncbi:alpha/beta hydrolase [Paraliomyxa miuraensis]|uniref:alpha/beta hydrolase n=1 Tax=Paraliomyxa miuraensis TaxID=376150 RepID=UPI00225BA01C|nr:alpha/beta fold hydrolase [Paraliomyxa miuraensis]MCX4243299.1 alpha/beta fold hydrolase [Paraliomyxa miuraensis]
MTIILFAHGLETGPWGRKSLALRDAGHEVSAPDCQGQDLATRIERLRQAILEAEVPPLVVGSSFGGIAGLVAALMAAEQGVVIPGLVLCAPALMIPPPPNTVTTLRRPAPTIIVHGTHDDVIPVEVSRRFSREHAAELREVDDDHRLAQAGIPAILEAVRELTHDG